MDLQLGILTFEPATEKPELLAKPVRDHLTAFGITNGLWVSEIDPALADTAAFCEQYGLGLDISANCVIVQAKRAERTWYAACLILATTKADINSAVRRYLEARKISFAPMDTATTMSHMEYGGITPVGLPTDWPILIDNQVAEQELLLIGSGLRRSKAVAQSALLMDLPNAVVLDIAKK